MSGRFGQRGKHSLQKSRPLIEAVRGRKSGVNELFRYDRENRRRTREGAKESGAGREFGTTDPVVDPTSKKEYEARKYQRLARKEKEKRQETWHATGEREWSMAKRQTAAEVSDNFVDQNWKRRGAPDWASRFREHKDRFREQFGSLDGKVGIMSRLNPQHLTKFGGVLPTGVLGLALDDLICQDFRVALNPSPIPASRTSDEKVWCSLTFTTDAGTATPLNVVTTLMSRIKGSGARLHWEDVRFVRLHPFMSRGTHTLYLHLSPLQQSYCRETVSDQVLTTVGGHQAKIGNLGQLDADLSESQRLLEGDASSKSQLVLTETRGSDENQSCGKAAKVPFSPVRHTLVARGVQGAMDALLESTKFINQHGFLNYTTNRLFGAHVYQVYRAGYCLLQRDYLGSFLCYLEILAADWPILTSPMKELRQRVQTEKGYRQHWNWAGALSATNTQIQQVKEIKDRSHGRSGLDVQQLETLRHCLEGASEAPLLGDPLGLMKELVGEDLMKVFLCVVSDVAWNGMATLRMKVHSSGGSSLSGARVLPGDVVCKDRAVPWDVAGSSLLPWDYQPRNVFLGNWIAATTQADQRFDSLCVIATEKEARQYSMQDVILPKPGKGDLPIFPAHSTCDSIAYDLMLRNLKLDGLVQSDLAPSATYRRLVCKPRLPVSIFCQDSLSFSVASSSKEQSFWSRHTSLDAKSGLLRIFAPSTAGGVLDRTTETPPDRQVPFRERFTAASKVAELHLQGRKGIQVGIDALLPPDAALTSLLRDLLSVTHFDQDLMLSLNCDTDETLLSQSCNSLEQSYHSKSRTV